MEYNLHTRHQIPKDYECCWNCPYMQWMVGIGQGVRCSNKENEYRIFRPSGGGVLQQPTSEKHRLKLPVIPGVARKCEHFEKKRENCKNES